MGQHPVHHVQPKHALQKKIACRVHSCFSNRRVSLFLLSPPFSFLFLFFLFFHSRSRSRALEDLILRVRQLRVISRNFVTLTFLFFHFLLFFCFFFILFFFILNKSWVREFASLELCQISKLCSTLTFFHFLSFLPYFFYFFLLSRSARGSNCSSQRTRVSNFARA